MITQKDIIREDCIRAISGNTNRLDYLKNENLLITGGTGFMGSWLSEMITYLNDTYHYNTHLFLLARRTGIFRERYEHLSSRDDITLIERDVRNLTNITDEITWIIHAAASPDSRDHVSDPLRTIGGIVNGTIETLEYATRLPELKKFLNISSGLIYGDQPWELTGIPENFRGGLDCSALNSVYAESKRLAETIGSVYRNQQRLPVVNIRPFAFIGPYQGLDKPWAINNFIQDSLSGRNIRILGDGQTVRSYMYPSDMAWWILNILVHGNVGWNYNLGSPEPISLQDLAEKIAGQFPRRPKIMYGISDNKSYRKSKFVPDVSLATNSLELKITTNLDTAIKRTIDWHRLEKR